MKKVSILIVIAMLVSVPFNFILTDEAGSMIITEFNGGLSENTITFPPGGGIDNSSELRIEKGAPVDYGFINVTGMPDSSSDYPTGLKLFFGDDTGEFWKYGDTGYGSFGEQNVYSDNLITKKLILPGTAYGNIGKVKIPRNATITKAVFEVTYGSDLMTIQPTNGKDASTRFQYPNNNYGTYVYLNYNGQKTHTFTQFNINSIPAGSDIESAYLHMKPNWWWSSRTYSIHRVLNQWWENNITWNNEPGIDTNTIDTQSFPNNANWKIFDVSTAVNNWYNNNWNNYGLMYKETSNNSDGGYIYSSEISTKANKPKLLVNYYKYPINPGLKFGGGGGSPDWSYSGKLQSVVSTSDLKNELNAYLASNPSSKLDKYGNDMVEVPLNVSADNADSVIVVRNIEIEYEYTHRINITSKLNVHTPDDPTNDGGYVDIPLKFLSTTGGKLKVDSIYVQYNHRPVMKSLDTPSITAIPDYHFPEDFNREKAIDLAYYFQDDWDDNRSLLYTVIWNSDPGHIYAELNSETKHHLDVRSKISNWTGSAVIWIEIEDSGGRKIRSNEFKIYFDPINDKPGPDDPIAKIVMDEDTVYDEINLAERKYFADAEGDTIYYDYDVDPLDVIEGEKVKVEIGTDKQLIITAYDNFNGNNIPVWIYADDGIYEGVEDGTEVAKYGSGKEYNYQELLVDIMPVNDAPIWNNINNTYIDEDEDLIDYLLLNDYVYDIESPIEDLTLSVFYNENKTKMGVDINENNNLSIRFIEENYIGSTFVTLEAKDEEGGRGYESFNVIVNPLNDLPDVLLESHRENQAVYGRINLEGTAFDNDGMVMSVEIKIGTDPVWKRTTGTLYWTHMWDATGLADGPYTVHLRAMDDEGEYSEPYSVKLLLSNDEAPNELPTIKITAPEDGTLVSDGSEKIRGTAFDRDGGIQGIEVRIGKGGVWKDAEGSIDWFYDLDTSEMPNGLITIFGRAYDGRAYSLEANVTINVFNPTVVDDVDDKDEKTETSDKGGILGLSYLYIILIIIVIVVIVIAIAGIVMRKKKKADAAQAEEARKADEAAKAAAAAAQVPGFAQTPAIAGAPAPGTAPTPALPPPTPVQMPSYPAAPTPVPIQAPQLPPGPAEAPPPAQVGPQYAPAPTPVPIPVPVPAPEPGVIDIQGISMGTTTDKPTQPQTAPSGATFTKPVASQPSDAFTVDLEFNSDTGEYKTVGNAKKTQ